MSSLVSNVTTSKVYRAMTSPVRLLPDFIIIGAARAGTTSLYAYLVEHPSIHAALRKEVHFYADNFQKGALWYRAHFPSALQKAYQETRDRQPYITGEATPYYLFHPYVPARIAQALPHVKLIALLRNPVERAYSHWQLATRLGHETLAFEQAVEREDARLAAERRKLAADETYVSFDYQHHSYLARGIYADQLEHWYESFPREQLLVLKSEDLYADPSSIYKQTLAFLEVAVVEPRSLRDGYPQHNKSEGRPARLDSALRARLMEFYKPHNARLYALLGRDFGWEQAAVPDASFA